MSLLGVAADDVAGALPVAAASLAHHGQTLVGERCVPCHARDEHGEPSRISGERKTPEGWHMTLTRMQHNNGLVLSDQEKDALVKYLADSQGLAPSEAAPYRYVLERRNNTIEKYNAINRPDPEGLARWCTTCHSYARIALQRRTEDEWRLLLHFHVSQFPAIEYHPQARTLSWWDEVMPSVPSTLTKFFPLSDDAWSKWRDRPSPDLSGRWRVVGHVPGVGLYTGTRATRRVAADSYETTTSVEYADGKQETHEGTGVVYTGYEWRGRTAARRESIREVYAVSADGREISGRWFVDRHTEQGAEFLAVKMEPGMQRVLAVDPIGIKAGATSRVTIYGIGLSGTPDFGPKIRAKVVSSAPERIVLEVEADNSAPIGVRPIKIGTTGSDRTLAVYTAVDHLLVEPAYAFSRLGEGGGKVPYVGAQFDAIAYAVAPSASGGKGAAFPVGLVPATWRLEPHTALAKEWSDQLYAGRMTAAGQFVPAQAGINPARTVGTPNNTGDLDVKATAVIDGRTLEGSAHLVVSTGALFFNVPIR